PAGAAQAGVCDWEEADGLTISNDVLSVTADPARGGSLTSVVDRRTGRNLLAGPGNDLVLQEEYEQHPRWGEGPWHLSPKGPGVSSSTVAARVTAERSPVGSRLGARYQLGDLTISAETILWDGAERRPRGRCRAGLVDAGHPGQPLVRARRRRPRGARRRDRRGAGGARGGRGDHPGRDAGRTAAADQGSGLLAGRRGRHRDDLARLRPPLRVGRRGLQPARLPDRARRSGGERLHRRAAHRVRPGG